MNVNIGELPLNVKVQMLLVSSLRDTKSSKIGVMNVATNKCIYIAKQKHLGCIKGEANQKQQLSDHSCD